jgi:phosphate transport system substrate-binding protein
MNPGAKLPHHDIVPVRRSDASGDTFLFTQFLDFSTQSWEDRIGYGTTVAWPPVPGEVTAGNDGMLKAIAGTPCSIGYIGISFSHATEEAGLAMALLKNQDGKFVHPSAETISAAASVLDPRTPHRTSAPAWSTHPARSLIRWSTMSTRCVPPPARPRDR